MTLHVKKQDDRLPAVNNLNQVEKCDLRIVTEVVGLLFCWYWHFIKLYRKLLTILNQSDYYLLTTRFYSILITPMNECFNFTTFWYRLSACFFARRRVKLLWMSILSSPLVKLHCSDRWQESVISLQQDEICMGILCELYPRIFIH